MAATSIGRVPRAAAAPAAAAMLVLSVLAGCATTPPPVTGPLYSGRIAVRTEATPAREARSVTGQFELRGTPAHGQLVLTSPIGTTVARARWKAADEAAAAGGFADIDLEANGRTAHFDNFDDMTQAALGDSLPLPAMFDWLSGRPWPHSPAAFDADRNAFEQLGWRVDRSRFETDQLIAADRPLPLPALHVRVKLDRGAEEPGGPASSPAAASPAPVAR